MNEKQVDEQIRAYRLELKQRELAKVKAEVMRVREQDEYEQASRSMDDEQFIRWEHDREKRKQEEERKAREDRERDERDVC
jgi:hypothetical protein